MAHLSPTWKNTRNIWASLTSCQYLECNNLTCIDNFHHRNYDVFSSSSHPGPNAPLGEIFLQSCLLRELITMQGDGCGTSHQPTATAEAALKQWTRAGMPASKLLLGLPLYGYVSKSTDKKLSGSFAPPGQTLTIAHPKSKRGVPLSGAEGDLSKLWGQQIAFSQLVEAGALVKKEGNYVAASGYTMGKVFQTLKIGAKLTCSVSQDGTIAATLRFETFSSII